VNGVVYIEIVKYAESLIGEQGWQAVVRQAGVPLRRYFRVADYPDAEAFALLGALSRQLERPVSEVLEGLGEFIVPDLMKMARLWIPPQWKTLDVVADTEQTIHEMLRQEGSNVTNPPRLRCRRNGSAEVVVTYDSSRRMCSLAVGIVRGLARHYGEQVSIDEPACMLKGAPACELVVRKL
jgi:predicted hydrocarbon binding protein